MRRPIAFVISIFLLVSLASVKAQDKAKADKPQRESSGQPCAPQPPPSVIQINIGGSLGTDSSRPAQQQAKTEAKPFMTHGEYVISIITTIYVIISFFTLRAIQQQANAAMDANCALVLIQWDNMVHLDPEVPNGVLHHCFNWTFSNGGKTPAFIQKVHSRFIVVEKLSDLPPKAVYLKPKEMSYESEPLMPDQKFQPGMYSPIESPLSYNDLEAAHRSKKCLLYAYGFVAYLDVYGRSQETRFGVAYESDVRPSIGHDRFQIAGPPAYNRYKIRQR